ncbi:glycosyltransferase family 4 protein [Haladaptatus caseinilyticus]|uniref:glycosyltransferase family 4 protein n=1 Tax=Haladaptatus caseinilyticus TaxID=2993314 RepID=UPI00224A95C0|nr:glycosyltransferase family 4 protein [Haladaptatus caseinilyticus]
MSRIAIVHPNLQMKGGAEDVCMQVIEALQDENDVTLLTLISPNITELNQYFDTNVRELSVRVVPQAITEICQRAGNRAVKLQSAILARFAKRNLADFDQMISTKNELALDINSVEYIHHPQYSIDDPGLINESLPRQAYDRLCRELADVDRSKLDSICLLANSDWTAESFHDAYGIRPKTVYPPVHTDRFSQLDWEDRENGFLTIGRIGPSKRILNNIEIVAQLRERGHDVHLHIAGPTTDGEYCDRVKRRAAELEFVHFEGSVAYDSLTELINEHRYGLHGRPYEHFGIVVAEMAAGGMVPFAPNSGGQREILNEESTLLYDSPTDAIEKIETILEDAERQTAVRETLSSTSQRFSRDRFKREIREIVMKEPESNE